jgi:hypothetical protein
MHWSNSNDTTRTMVPQTVLCHELSFFSSLVSCARMPHIFMPSNGPRTNPAGAASPTAEAPALNQLFATLRELWKAPTKSTVFDIAWSFALMPSDRVQAQETLIESPSTTVPRSTLAFKIATGMWVTGSASMRVLMGQYVAFFLTTFFFLPFF